MLMLRSNLSAGSRKEGAQGTVASLRKKNFQGCVSQDSAPMNSILRKVEELGLNASAVTHQKILRMHLAQNWIREEKGIGEEPHPKGEPHERNPCAPGFEEWTPEETSWQADWQQCSVEFGEKIHNAEQDRFMLKWKGILHGTGPQTLCRYWPRLGKSK